HNGSIANGSRRTSPILLSAAAVPSDATLDARKTPCSQSNASVTSGAVVARRPPNRIAEIGTPSGSSHSGAMIGHCDAGQAKRALGGAAGSPRSGDHLRPLQSVRFSGGVSVRPSHHTSPSAVKAVLVKIVLARNEPIALALVLTLVPGATPKKPAS